MNMLDLFYPKSIVIVGASRNRAKLGSVIFRNILSSNYQGELYLVNPQAELIEGYPVITDVTQLPQGISLGIVVIPADYVLKVVEDLGRKGVKYLIVISAGFREIGKQGLAREKDLQKLLQAYGMRLIGPNCLGIINNEAHKLAYNGSFAQLSKQSGNISFISQSGALISAFIDKAEALKLGFNKIISLGNVLDIDETEILSYLQNDSKTRVIILYLEGIKRPVEFIRQVKNSLKPIIVLKAGQSARAQQTIQSHTGSLAGDRVVVATLLQEAGAILVDNLDELFDTMQLFNQYSKVSSQGVGVVTNAGGVGVLSVDCLVRAGLNLSQLEEKASQKLKKILPLGAALVNPVDILGDAGVDRYRGALQILLKERSVASLLVVITPQIMTPLSKIGQLLSDLSEKYKHKPLIPVFVGGQSIPVFSQDLGQLVYYTSPERAILALKKLYDWNHQSRNGKLWDHPTTYVKKSSIKRIKQAIATDQGYPSASWQTISIIAKELSLAMPKTMIIKKSSDLAKLEASFTYPVVIKNVDPQVLHRSEKGLVKVGIENLKPLQDFYKKNKQGQVIVQEQAKKGVEVFVGMKRDAQMGLILVLGFGGIYAEIIHDIAYASMPITKAYILKTLKKTKVYTILAGARGTSYDITWLIQTIFQLNLLIYSIPSIKELDVNPIVVQQRGGSILDLKVII